MNKLLPLAVVLLAAWAAPATAADGTPIEGCVTLSDNHEGVRYGSRYLLVKDGDAHYRVDFGKSCSALTLASGVAIKANGQPNQLCATGTKIASKRATCRARAVEAIDAEAFDRYKRRG